MSETWIPGVEPQTLNAKPSEIIQLETLVKLLLSSKSRALGRVLGGDLGLSASQIFQCPRHKEYKPLNHNLYLVVHMYVCVYTYTYTYTYSLYIYIYMCVCVRSHSPTKGKLKELGCFRLHSGSSLPTSRLMCSCKLDLEFGKP